MSRPFKTVDYHADASKSKAVSYKRLLEIEAHLRTGVEVEALFALAKQLNERERPDGLMVRDEIARREDRLARLAEAQAVIAARARERDALDQAAYAEKRAHRAQKVRATGRRPGGRPLHPSDPGSARRGPLQRHRPRRAYHEEPYGPGL